MKVPELLKEAEYAGRMRNEVLPYLDGRRTSGFFEAAPGQALYYEHYDTEEEPRGIVVILHGYSESLPKHYETVYYFLRGGYHVRQLSLRGHGKSYRYVSDPSLIHVPHWRLFLTDLDAYLGKVVKPGNRDGLPLILFGHSMGGAIGGLYLERRPDVFSAAVLSSPMMELKSSSVPIGVQYLAEIGACLAGRGKQYAARTKPYDGTWTFEHSNAGTRPRWEYWAGEIPRHREYQTWGASWQMGRELIRMTKAVRAKRSCARVRADVLLLSAGRDRLVTQRGQEEFISRIPGGRIEYFPDATHEIYTAEDPILSRYWTCIADFLTETAEKAAPGTGIRNNTEDTDSGDSHEQ